METTSIMLCLIAGRQRGHEPGSGLGDLRSGHGELGLDGGLQIRDGVGELHQRGRGR